MSDFKRIVAAGVVMLFAGVVYAQSPTEVTMGGADNKPTAVAESVATAVAATTTTTTTGTAANEVNVPTAKPMQVAPVRKIEEMVIDTLPTINDAIKIVLFNDNTWRYVRDREAKQDSTVFEKYWSTIEISPYRTVELSTLPTSVAIALVDSLKSYHYPYKGRIISRY